MYTRHIVLHLLTISSSVELDICQMSGGDMYIPLFVALALRRCAGGKVAIRDSHRFLRRGVSLRRTPYLGQHCCYVGGVAGDERWVM